MGWRVRTPAALPCLIFTEGASRTTHLLLDHEHRVIGALVGRPREPDKWNAVHSNALAALRAASDSLSFSEREEGGGRRGPFPTIAHGLSLGGGQEVRVHRCLPQQPAEGICA
jgi:hypothetical protein